MIADRMKTYEVQTRKTGTDDYGQPLTGYDRLKDTEVSITLLTDVLNELDPRYKTGTHLGLSYDKTLLEDMKIIGTDESYIIKIVNNDAPMSQLNLEVV